MWEPQHLTTLWAFTAYYRDTFIFTFITVTVKFILGEGTVLKRNNLSMLFRRWTS
jgi:hypothetical protein